MGTMLLRYLSEKIMERWESLMITVIVIIKKHNI